MNNVLFRKVLKPANHMREEIAVAVEVTEENNGYCVFLIGHPNGTVLLRHSLYNKMELIEWAVLHAKDDENVLEALSAPLVAYD